MVCRKVWESAQGILYVYHSRANWLDLINFNREQVQCSYHLLGNIHNSHSHWSLSFFSLVSTLKILTPFFGGLAMIQAIPLDKSINAFKIRNWVSAKLVLMDERSELCIVLLTFNLSRHISPLEVFDSFDQTIKILFFFELHLFLGRKLKHQI